MNKPKSEQIITHRFESGRVMTDEEFDEWASHTPIPNGVTEMRAAPIIESVRKGELCTAL